MSWTLLLHDYVYNGKKVEVAQMCQAIETRLDANDYTGRSALFYINDEPASLACAEILIMHGADVNRVNGEDGATPLIEECDLGNTQAARLLIQHRADIEWQDTQDKSTALMRAAINGRVECVRLLLEHKANVRRENSKGKTALQLTDDCQCIPLLEQAELGRHVLTLVLHVCPN